MDLYPLNDLSPPATPPSCSSSTSSNKSYRHQSSYLDISMGDSPLEVSSMLDKNRLDYIARVKHTFQQLDTRQKHFFLSEILACCDNQLLAFLNTLIAPRLKIDFLKQLPTELALHVLSFVDDPRTLARASRVSRYWNNLLKDDSTWKELCLKQYYRQKRLRIPMTNLSSIASFREYFRRKYNIDAAWRQGGKVISCHNDIDSALVTSLQVEDPFIVVGCDNHHIEVFDSTTGKHVRTLLGHEGGVWALQFLKVSDNETILVSGGCDRSVLNWRRKRI